MMMNEEEERAPFLRSEEGGTATPPSINGKVDHDLSSSSSSSRRPPTTDSKKQQKTAEASAEAFQRNVQTWCFVLTLLILSIALLMFIFLGLVVAFIPVGCLHWLMCQPYLDRALLQGGGWASPVAEERSSTGSKRRRCIIQGLGAAILHLDKDPLAILVILTIVLVNGLSGRDFASPKPTMLMWLIMAALIVWGGTSSALLLHVGFRKVYRTVQAWPHTTQLRAREWLVGRCLVVLGGSILATTVTLINADYAPIATATAVGLVAWLILSNIVALVRVGRYLHSQDWYRQVMLWDVATTPTTAANTQAYTTEQHGEDKV